MTETGGKTKTTQMNWGVGRGDGITPQCWVVGTVNNDPEAYGKTDGWGE